MPTYKYFEIDAYQPEEATDCYCSDTGLTIGV